MSDATDGSQDLQEATEELKRAMTQLRGALEAEDDTQARAGLVQGIQTMPPT